MKIFSFLITTTTLVFLTKCMLVLSSSWFPVIFILINAALLGIIMLYIKPRTKHIGWGILFGSLTFDCMLFCYLMWEAFHPTLS